MLVLGVLIAVLGWTAPAGASPGQRIVSLAPSVTETLFAIHAGPEVVGVSEYCDYPPAALKLPRVGSFLTPSVEAIVGLRPSLIVGLETSANEREIRALESMGYPVLLINDDSLQGIEDGIEKIGERTGHVQQAREVLTSMRARMHEVERRLRAIPARKVLVVVGHDPLVAVGGGYLNQLLGSGGLCKYRRRSGRGVAAGEPGIHHRRRPRCNPRRPDGQRPAQSRRVLEPLSEYSRSA